MLTVNELVRQKAQEAKAAAAELMSLSTKQRNDAIVAMAEALENPVNIEDILVANAQDLAQGVLRETSKAMMDRLLLDEARIRQMAQGLRQLLELPDPLGEILDGFRRPNGLTIRKVAVPLGVVGMIYEARPNVTVDAAGLCIKSGNSVLLRGGSEAIHSNTKLIQILRTALAATAVPPNALAFIDSTDRVAVEEMLQLRGYVDVLIPRGGAGLIQKVVEESRIPVIETGAGVCHTYVDEGADLAMAEAIILNAKVSRPSVCNALETLLVHEQAADALLPMLIKRLQSFGVEIRGCMRTLKYGENIMLAEESDWNTEYNDLVLSVKVVDTMMQAIEHINQYNTKHSETIVTRDYQRAKVFQQLVDAAVVYVNASTRFTDGFEFGFGAEIGISTQKLHARGPMGLKALTSIKYLVDGSGQIRK